MALQTKKVEIGEVSTEIDLKKLLGQSSKNDSIREVFYQAAFDKLIERLDQGRGVDGKLHRYSKAYMNSLEFHAFGKTKTVNMQLTGDMVHSIKPIDSNDSFIKIGIDDELQAAKAHGHMTGMNGKTQPRNWFGWKDSELKSIADSIKPEVNNKSVITDAIITKLLNKLVG